MNPDPRARIHANDSLRSARWPLRGRVDASLRLRALADLEPVPSPGLAAPHRTATTMIHSIHRIALACTFVLLSFAQLGCDPVDEGDDEAGEGATETDTGDTTETGGDSLEIVGSYTDEWTDIHTITTTTWTNASGTFIIEFYDNDADYLGAYNDLSNMYSPGRYSRFDWHFEGTTLYYCQSAFDAASLNDALAASADPSDLATGCAGFPWTRLS